MEGASGDIEPKQGAAGAGGVATMLGSLAVHEGEAAAPPEAAPEPAATEPAKPTAKAAQGGEPAIGKSDKVRGAGPHLAVQQHLERHVASGLAFSATALTAAIGRQVVQREGSSARVQRTAKHVGRFAGPQRRLSSRRGQGMHEEET